MYKQLAGSCWITESSAWCCDALAGWDEGRGGRLRRKVMYTHSGCASWYSRPTQYYKAAAAAMTVPR